MNMSYLGENIRRLRISYEETQAELGDVLNVTKQAVCAYEAGKRDPDQYMLAVIANHYMISLDELVNTEIPKMRRVRIDPKYIFSRMDTFFPMIEYDGDRMNPDMVRAQMLHHAIISEMKNLEMKHLPLLYECLCAYEAAFKDKKCRAVAAANYVGLWYLLLIVLKIVPDIAKEMPAPFYADEEEKRRIMAFGEAFGEEAERLLDKIGEQGKEDFYDECLTYIIRDGNLSDLGYFYQASAYIWGVEGNDLSINMNRRFGYEMMRKYAHIGNPFAKGFLSVPGH